MSILREVMVEVLRRKDETGKLPETIYLNPITKKEMESELKLRPSYSEALKHGREMVINRLFEPLTEGPFKGHPKPNGWEIPVEARNDVPMGQVWVAVDGYDIGRSEVGRKIPRHILKGRSVS